MIAEIKQDHSSITVYRAPGSPRVHSRSGNRNIRSESAFWYALRNHLRAAGFDVVKRRMSKDGHMVSSYIFYLRERKWKWALHDGQYAIRSLSEDFNKDGHVDLRLEPLLEGAETPDLTMAGKGAA